MAAHEKPTKIQTTSAVSILVRRNKNQEGVFSNLFILGSFI